MQLRLTLTVVVARSDRGTREIVAEGSVQNAGAEAATLDLVELASPSLALEIVDARDVPVRMPPPSTPGRPELVMLEPGARRSVVYRDFMPSTTASGRYRVRMRYRDARSAWQEVTLE